MPLIDQITEILGETVVAAPALAVLGLGGLSLLGWPPSERTISRVIQLAVVLGLLSALTVLGLMLGRDQTHVPIDLGDWVSIPHYQFHIKFLFDRLSVPFVILTFLLCGTVGAFAAKYMHREPGFVRFHLSYALFVLGMVTASLAGTIETLFVGWEMVGLSSALLVAFFHERAAPPRNGLRVWIVYRISDAALLVAAIVMHHMHGHGDFDHLLGAKSWPEGICHLEGVQPLIVGSLLLLAAAGKSALVPFSSWLPRAMEGPTPSSAVFYGALSVHLGAFLLLRFSPLLDVSPTLRVFVIAIGLATAIFAALTVRVQTDIKSDLSFASLIQVGLIVVEIGLGLRYIALLHILGHGCFRTLQFLRAPSLLQDYRTLENAIDSVNHLGTGSGATPPTRTVRPPQDTAFRDWLYRFALERGYLDALLERYIAKPVVRLFEKCDSLERRYAKWLSTSWSASARRSPPTQRDDAPDD